MNSRFLRHLSFAVLLIAPSLASAQAVDNHLVLNVGVGGTASGSVDLLFRDFTTAGDLGDYEWIRPAIELQIAPNLAAGQELQSVYLNFTPDIDIRKLQLYWTGSPMPPGPPGADTFGTPGTEPSTIAIARNGFYAGGGQLFDIFMNWSTPFTFSKLLLYYNERGVDLTFADFTVTSSTAPFFSDPPFGPLLAAGGVAGAGGSSGTIAAIPEPSASAMLALGLLALIFATRRRWA